MNEETLNLPPSYGTKKCYDCGLEPRSEDNWWERFVEIDGKEVSVPQCEACGFIMEQRIKAHGSKKHVYTPDEIEATSLKV